jgi:hypothetical protein
MSKNAPTPKRAASAKTRGAQRAAVKPAHKDTVDDTERDAVLDDDALADDTLDEDVNVDEDAVEDGEYDEDVVTLDDEEAEQTLELFSSAELEDDEDAVDGADEEIVEELRENPVEEASEEDEVVEVLGGLEAVIGFDDTVQKRPKRRTVDEDDEDDDESYLVREKQSYEFLCQGCFLVRNKAQQRGTDPALCNDCF